MDDSVSGGLRSGAGCFMPVTGSPWPAGSIAPNVHAITPSSFCRRELAMSNFVAEALIVVATIVVGVPLMVVVVVLWDRFLDCLL